MYKSVIIAVLTALVVGLFNPVVAASGNNTCPDGAAENHFCALSPGKLEIDPETGEEIKMAREWSMPSCNSLQAYKGSERIGWDLLFTENCDENPAPVPTDSPQPLPQPTDKPAENPITVETEKLVETVIGNEDECEGLECICIDLGEKTQNFIWEVIKENQRFKLQMFDLVSELLKELVATIASALKP